MHKKIFRINLHRVLQDRASILAFSIAVLAMLGAGLGFIDRETLKGNLGGGFALAEIVLHIILSLLFGIFLATHVYKYNHSQMNIKNKATGALGGFLGILVTGCPSCGITVAAYLGLAGLFASLPFHGIELKVIGIIVLVYAEYVAIRDLMVCKIKPKS